MNAGRFLTTKEAAEYVGGSTKPRTIVAWIRSKRLKAYRNPSQRGHYKIKPEDLVAAMNYEPESQ
jgi:excisionase family DNA binding protein